MGEFSEAKTMKAAVLYGPGDLRVESRPLPQARTGWVVIAVEAAGICGTDVAIYHGKVTANPPVVLGHEFAGRILAVGKAISSLKEGQRVIAPGGWAAGNLFSHDADAPGRRLSAGALGQTVDGCFAEAVAVPAKIVHVLPDEVNMAAAQSVTVLACAVHAVERVGDVVNKRIAIIGPGFSGLLLLQVCIAAGAREVIVLGTRDNRLSFATALGAQSVVNVRSAEFEIWRQQSENQQFDITFEASGTASGLAQAFSLTRSDGTVVSYGIITNSLDGVPGYEIYSKQLTILGSRGTGGRYEEAISLLALGKVRVEPMITHFLPIDDAVKGFSIMINRLEDVLRVVFTPGKPAP